jgi:hypothetical protein
LDGESAVGKDVSVSDSVDYAVRLFREPVEPGIAQSDRAAPRQVGDGIERIRWIPAANGGPSTYVQLGPGDNKGYKGDFLTSRELRHGGLRFDGYFRSEWPSNASTVP